jgi:hypothetical protein
MKKLIFLSKKILLIETLLIFASLVLKITHFGGAFTSIVFAMGWIGMFLSVIAILAIVYYQMSNNTFKNSQN